MVGTKFIALVALALGAAAAPPQAGSAEGKPFKLQVTFVDPKETVYLTDRAAASKNPAEATTCKVNAGKIACGPKGYGIGFGDMHSSKTVRPEPNPQNNKNFSVSSDGTIRWTQGNRTPVTFSYKGQTTSLYAEICTASGHGDGAHKNGQSGGLTKFTAGTAKAIFI